MTEHAHILKQFLNVETCKYMGKSYPIISYCRIKKMFMNSRIAEIGENGKKPAVYKFFRQTKSISFPQFAVCSLLVRPATTTQ